MGAAVVKRMAVILYNEPVEADEPSEAGVLTEAQDVAEAARSLGWAVEVFGVSRRDLCETVDRVARVRDRAVVFNLCEGLEGAAIHEPLVPALLHLRGIRFTGSPAQALSLALQKDIVKTLLRGVGVPTPRAVVMEEPDQTWDGVPLPAVVKPVREDGSVGITTSSLVRSASELRRQVAWLVATFGQPALVEAYVPGREFNVALIGEGKALRALPVAEIVFDGFAPEEPRLVTHAAKWRPHSVDDLRTVPVCPADVGEELGRELVRVAMAACRVIGCRDYTRVDIRVDGEGTPMVIDVNPNPDVSRSAGLARAVEAAGMSYEEFVGTILEVAWTRTW